MKIYYRDVTPYGKPSPNEIATKLGWLFGKLVLIGGGYVIGQVIRGLFRLVGIVLPSLF